MGGPLTLVARARGPTNFKLNFKLKLKLTEGPKGRASVLNDV